MPIVLCTVLSRLEKLMSMLCFKIKITSYIKNKTSHLTHLFLVPTHCSLSWTHNHVLWHCPSVHPPFSSQDTYLLGLRPG